MFAHHHHQNHHQSPNPFSSHTQWANDHHWTPLMTPNREAVSQPRVAARRRAPLPERVAEGRHGKAFSQEPEWPLRGKSVRLKKFIYIYLFISHNRSNDNDVTEKDGDCNNNYNTDNSDENNGFSLVMLNVALMMITLTTPILECYITWFSPKMHLVIIKF